MSLRAVDLAARQAAPAPCRPGVPARMSSTAPIAGEAEVHDAHLARAVEHHVRRLQVAMEDAPLVRRGEAGAELTRDLGGLVLGKSADAPQRRGEIFAVDVLHREEQRPSASPMSYTRQTFGCETWRAVRTSL